MNIPPELRYTEDHEWARTEGSSVRVGITDYAQDALGDVVFVQLPTIGTHVEARSSMGEVESTKSVSDIYSPIAGTVAAVNDALSATPELVNSDPYGQGWICDITPDDAGSVDTLLDAAAYERLVSS